MRKVPWSTTVASSSTFFPVSISECKFPDAFTLITSRQLITYHTSLLLSYMHTHYIDRSEDSIMAVIPDISQFNTRQPQKKDGLRVPLFLVRIDGIIYSTGMTFTYAAEPGTFSTQNGQG